MGYLNDKGTKSLYSKHVTNDVTLVCWQHLMVTARRFTVIIEEKLLLKLLSFFGYGQTDAGRSSFCQFMCGTVSKWARVAFK